MPDFREFDQEAYPEQTRVNRLKVKKLKKTKIVLSTLVLLLVFASAAYGAMWLYGAASVRGWFKQSAATAAGGTSAPAREAVKGRVNIMMTGVDQRGNEPTRTDTLMVAMLNLDRNTIDLISIPRDTRVAIEGVENKTRINHAHAYGGIELTKKTVEQFLGIPIDYYVEANFKGFRNIIDILGGLDLDVEKRMYKPEEDIDLKKGFQHLDGQGALAYVRYRDEEGDLGRIQRQHKFISVLADQFFKPATFLKLPGIAWQLKQNVASDLSVSEGIYLSGQFKNAGSDGVVFHNLPGVPQYIGGASYFVADEEAVSELIEGILHPAAKTSVPAPAASERNNS